MNNEKGSFSQDGDLAQETYFIKAENERRGPYLGWETDEENSLGDTLFKMSFPVILIAKLSLYGTALLFCIAPLRDPFNSLFRFRKFDMFFGLFLVLCLISSLYYAQKGNNNYSACFYVGFHASLGFFLSFAITYIEVYGGGVMASTGVLVFAIVNLTSFAAVYIAYRPNCKNTPQKELIITSILAIIIISMLLLFWFDLKEAYIYFLLVLYAIGNIVIGDSAAKHCSQEISWGFWMAAPLYYMGLKIYFTFRFIIECGEAVLYILAALAK